MIGCGKSLQGVESVVTAPLVVRAPETLPERFWISEWARCGIRNQPTYDDNDYGLGTATLDDVILCMDCAKKHGVIW